MYGEAHIDEPSDNTPRIIWQSHSESPCAIGELSRLHSPPMILKWHQNHCTFMSSLSLSHLPLSLWKEENVPMYTSPPNHLSAPHNVSIQRIYGLKVLVIVLNIIFFLIVDHGACSLHGLGGGGRWRQDGSIKPSTQT